MSGNNNLCRNSPCGASNTTNPRGRGNFSQPPGPTRNPNAPPMTSKNNAAFGANSLCGFNVGSNANEFNPRGRSESVSGFGIRNSSGSQVPQSPPRVAPNFPTVSYNEARELPTDLQQWTHEQLVVFLRCAFVVKHNGRTIPNYDYEPDVNIAIRDAFDANSQLMSELILRVANQGLSNPSDGPARREALPRKILAYRHSQRHSVLVLPPRTEALDTLQALYDGVEAARWGSDRSPNIAFPNWKKMMGRSATTSPSGPKSHGLGAGEPFTPVKGKGLGGPDHGRMGGRGPSPAGGSDGGGLRA